MLSFNRDLYWFLCSVYLRVDFDDVRGVIRTTYQRIQNKEYVELSKELTLCLQLYEKHIDVLMND